MQTNKEFRGAEDFMAALAAMPGPDLAVRGAAEARNAELTKPAGSLGRLEELAIWYAGWRGVVQPAITRPQAIIFAGNHGVTAQGVSAFPAEVTAQMVGNFASGGAAINQLCRANGIGLSVQALELERPTADFTAGPAMSDGELGVALSAGWNAVDPAADLLVVGEMGIGNTTVAAAIAFALFGGDARDWVGRGTGVDDAGLQRKIKAIERGVEVNSTALGDSLAVLAALGGREIAAMAGAIGRARMLRIPVVLDGFICGAAAAVLACAKVGSLEHCVAGHVSAEAAHGRLLAKLELQPVLALGLRLGEGSGAALAVSILKSALACHSGMATFAEAAVSGKA